MSTYEGPVGTCELCGSKIALDHILKHLQVVHGLDVEPLQWPDGEPVVIDTTLEPGDFDE